MPYIEEEGIFRGINTAQAIIESQSSKSVALSLSFTATEMLDQATNKWRPLATPHHVRGRFYVIGRDGTINSRVVEDLIAIGWNASMAGVGSEPTVSRECQFSVKAQDPKPGSPPGSRVFYNAAFVNPFDYAPSAGGEKFAAPASRAAELDAQFGAQLRAIKAGVPPAAAAPAPAAAPTPEEGGEFDEVPF